MTLFTHVAPHPDALVTRLCDELAHPPEDLFTPEVVAVPTRGIERWLTQRIASGLADRGVGDGICANVGFPSPRRLVREVLSQVPVMADAMAVWEGPALTASLVETLDACVAEPWMAMIARYLDVSATARDASSPRRLAASAKITHLYTGYARRRPAMIRSWADGREVGAGFEPLADGEVWQPRLWRMVRERIAAPSPPELMPEVLAPLRDGSVELDLPDRLAVYGLTATDPFDLQVLVAVAEGRDVHVHVLHPSPALWSAVAEATERGPAGASAEVPDAPGPVPGAPVSARPRSEDPTPGLAAHPLLAAWGRDSRELQLVLADHGITGTPAETAPLPGAEAATILGRLQADVLANRAPEAAEALAATVTAGTDRSIQVHECHGARRQAEVVRDAVMHVLAGDPSLEPRDVVIMTPDLATFAPLLEAAFPSADERAGGSLPDLRLRIADRSPAATNPLVRFAATLMDLADSRLEAGVVRELVARPVVQQRFGYDADTAGAIVSLIDDAHVAWGLDAGHREAWGAGQFADRTWVRGLDRALTGVFYSDSPVRLVATTTPLDGVEGQDADPAGLLAQILDRLATVRAAMAEPRPVSQWAELISVSVRMLAAPAWGDDWQLDQLERLLTETFPDETGSGLDPTVSRAEARSAIGAWTEDRPSPLHFRTGDVTVCTLAPMRSVPYRVVCLLGMDDERFPRAGRSDGDDLLAAAEMVGDHDRSAEDRQLLLDAVMAAGQHLIVTFSGHHELTNAELPPAVPIAELIDVLEDMVGPDGRKRLVTRHPLQAFSADNFTPGRLGVDGPWGYDPNHLAGARAVEARPDTPPTGRPPWAPAEDPGPVRLDDLIAFLKHPVKRFVRNRLRFTIPELDEIADDSLPADLSPLEMWAVADRILSGLIKGHRPPALTERERWSDALPPGDLGQDDIDEAHDRAVLIFQAACDRGFRPEAQRPLTGAVEAGGRRVEGTVSVDPGHELLVQPTPSRLKAKQRLEAYVRMVFASVLDPDKRWRSLLVGRNTSGPKLLAVTFGPIGDTPASRLEQATARMAALVSLYGQGHDGPIPMPCESAFAWQSAVDRGDNPFWDARRAWENDEFAPEMADPVHRLALPEIDCIEALIDAGLEAYSRRLWAPILEICSEQVL